MAQPYDHMNETDDEDARQWAERLDLYQKELKAVSSYDESEKTIRWVSMAAIAAVTIVLLGMASCEKVSVIEKGKAMAACTSVGGSWLRAGDGAFHCLRLGAEGTAVAPADDGFGEGF